MRFAFSRVGVVVCLSALSGLAQSSLSVDQLIQFIHSSIQLKTPDKELASYLAHVKLSQKLDDRTIENLQGEGAGPKTVAALNHLKENSESLPAAALQPPPPKPKPIPPPPYEEQQRVINETREYALNYTKSLPNFICLQVTRRYYDPAYNPGTEGSWHNADRIAAKLSYFEQKENYQLLNVNDTAAIDRSYESVGGAISRGEFGSMLKEIFDPDTNTEFEWERWATLRGNRCHVYRYHVDQPHSKWTVDYERRDQVTPAYEGEIFIDKKTNMVLRVTLDALVPATFPIQEVHERLDYDYVDISGNQFLLPLVAQVRMRHDRLATKNDVEFRSYRKYSAETSITFEDAAEPLPEDKTKEQVPK